MLLSEFECPRTILIKQQQQQQHIFFKKIEKKITLDMVPSTLDPRQKDRLVLSGHLYLNSTTQQTPEMRKIAANYHQQIFRFLH